VLSLPEENDMDIKIRNLLSIKNESSKESDNDNGDINEML